MMKKKPSLAIIMGGMDKDEGDDEYQPETGGKEEAAQAILSAIAKKDAKALAKAVCALHDLHMAEDEEEADEE